MALWQKIILGVGIVVLALVTGIGWYLARHSMRAAAELEINSPTANERVLIATQGSSFKDSVVAGVIAHLKERHAYAKVIDVAALPLVREADWSAIVVLHTWEMEKPQQDAQRFIASARDPRKVIVLTTSGSGTARMPGVDAISSASEMIDVSNRVAEIDSRLDSLLAKP